MKKLYKRFDLFCYRHRSWGIPNLMLYVALGTAIVSILTTATNNPILFNWLCFDKAQILNGQVWRLFSYVLIDRAGSGLLSLLFLYFFYMLGRHVENTMGTLKFNLFYFTGILLMDAFAMIFSPSITNELVVIDGATANSYAVYLEMGFYLHLSLLLMFAATYPDMHFLVMLVIPVKAWVMSLIYLVLVLLNISSYVQAGVLFPNYLFPLVGIANFLLFAGPDVMNVLPPSWRRNGYRHVRHNKQTRDYEPKPFQRQEQPKQEAPSYTHRCTICGRTDVTNPELEFRYCSRCNGYFCYCEDHINNHTHVE